MKRLEYHRSVMNSVLENTAVKDIDRAVYDNFKTYFVTYGTEDRPLYIAKDMAKLCGKRSDLSFLSKYTQDEHDVVSIVDNEFLHENVQVLTVNGLRRLMYSANTKVGKFVRLVLNNVLDIVDKHHSELYINAIAETIRENPELTQDMLSEMRDRYEADRIAYRKKIDADTRTIRELSKSIDFVEQNYYLVQSELDRTKDAMLRRGDEMNIFCNEESSAYLDEKLLQRYTHCFNVFLMPSTENYEQLVSDVHAAVEINELSSEFRSLYTDDPPEISVSKLPIEQRMAMLTDTTIVDVEATYIMRPSAKGFVKKPCKSQYVCSMFMPKEVYMTMMTELDSCVKKNNIICTTTISELYEMSRNLIRSMDY
jgi:hypothetical protein